MNDSNPKPETTPQFQMARFYLGRWLLHLGLRTLPPGACRTELTQLLWSWGMHVRQVVTHGR
jgi:hypothetical protein